ncbi:MAG: DUF4185 domain-containing protein [Chloroflexi bacterium]|nr:DUF4185 domain-containing protein [Chloroflexota bacterium]
MNNYQFSTRRALVRGILAGGAATLLAACAPSASQTDDAPPELPEADRALKAVTGVEQVACIAGKDSINETGEKWTVYGTDLGSMFDKDGKIYMVFGDTFGCCPPGTGGPGGAGDWRYNVMAVISDRDPKDGLTFDTMITDRQYHAKQLITKEFVDTTVIPTYGVAVGDRMFLHYMGVRSWGTPGSWTLSSSGLAYSDDDGETWHKDSGVSWAGDSNFGQVAFVKEGNFLYLFGIPGGRFGGVALARVPQDKVLDQAAYRYYSGQFLGRPVWSKDEKEAKLIVPAPVGELSVIWNAYLERWIMTYLDEHRAAIVIREAREMWGPWSPPLTLVSGKDYPALYGAYMHPWYVENDGETIYFAMSQWGPYSVFWMKATLVKN